MVSPTTTANQWSELYSSKTKQSAVPSHKEHTTQIDENEDGSLQIVGKCLISAGLSEQASFIIMQSWRKTTCKQYGSYLKRWMQFCSQQQVDKINPSLGDIIVFLTELHEAGLGYSAINTAKSMLSSIFSVIHKQNIGTEPLIQRFMKGIFHLKPSVPKTLFTWDVKIVLDFLSDLDTESLTLKLLSMKLATLLILVTGQRCQTLFALRIDNMEIAENYIKIRVGNLLKQSKPGKHLAELYLESFPKNKNICVVRMLKHYLNKTKMLRSSSELFIITQKPYNPASKNTIAKWIKLCLKLAGIDMSVFTPHSTRGAATSAAITKVPIDTVIKTAGWTRDCTFRKFYKKPITNDSSFSHALLNQ